MKSTSKTSWENVSQWYNSIVSDKGHYYHKELIFPKLLKLLQTKKQNQSLLDLGCGNGVLRKILPKNYSYHGVDISKSLLKKAPTSSKDTQFSNFDICQPFNLEKTDFTHAVMLLSFQNLKEPLNALLNTKKHLKQGGLLYLIINHPCFRVPRQSSWGNDKKQKIQYRKVQKYMSSLEVPITTNPSQENSSQTYSYHHSLSDISSYLTQSGFAIHSIDEWTSNKISEGTFAKQENVARKEIPLFMLIVAKSL